MARVRGSIDIDRPVEQVFAVLADQRNEVLYNSEMRSSVKLTDGPIGVGTVFQAEVGRRRPRPVRIVCTAYRPPHVFATRSTAGAAVVDGTVRCDPAGSGTRLSWDWRITLSGPSRLAGPLVGLIGRRQERRIWTGLEHYLLELHAHDGTRP